MKPRVELKQRAIKEPAAGTMDPPPRACIVLIDGIPFRSDARDGHGFTSLQINTAAERLVEEFKKL